MDTFVYMIPLGELTPWDLNYRRGDIAAIRKSLRQFGLNGALRVRNRVVMAGNQTLAALKEMHEAGEDPPAKVLIENGSWMIPAIDLSHLSDDEAVAFAIADNRTHDLGSDDQAQLALLLSQFDSDSDLLHVLGYSGDDLESLLSLLGGGESTAPDEFDVPELATVDTRTKPGDLWMIGSHRLLVGDCTEKPNVDRLFGGEIPFIMVTDPPYGVNYDPDWRFKQLKQAENPSGRRTGKVKNDHRADWQEAWDLAPCDVAYVWHASGGLQAVVLNSLEQAGYEPRNHIIWAKQNFPIGRGNYHHRHEPCWYAVRKGKNAQWKGGRKQSTVWNDIGLDKNVGLELGGHGTQKPVECMARPIRNHGKKGDIVYDPFLGSGTTIIAAESVGRRCFGMEIDPVYATIILNRCEAAGLPVEFGGGPT
jgi:DNA modification methylase